jgi:hypothetical protein
VTVQPDLPSAFDPQRILEVLARHDVLCVVIGGYAAALAGVDIVTRDVDITPALDADYLQRLANALEELHAGNRGPMSCPSRFRPIRACSLAGRSGTSRRTRAILTSPQCLMAPMATRICGVAPAARSSGTACTGRPAHRHRLAAGHIRSKTAASRAKDLAALPQLRAALERQQA